MIYGSDPTTEAWRFLVIGKAGNGKSSLCNVLVGEDKFAVTRGMSTGTTTAHAETASRDKFKQFKVIDTPDITNCGLNESERQEEVATWRKMTFPGLTAVLLTISCAVRYTKEEYDIYKEIVNCWGGSTLKDRLIVVFTFGDQLDGSIEDQIMGSSPELKSVLSDADQTYFVFNKKNKESRDGALRELFKATKTRGKWRKVSSSSERDRDTSQPLLEAPPSSASAGYAERGLYNSKRPCNCLGERKWMVTVLLALVVITAILFIIFMIIQYIGLAIGFGVTSLTFVAVIGVVVYCTINRSHRVLI